MDPLRWSNFSLWLLSKSAISSLLADIYLVKDNNRNTNKYVKYFLYIL